MIIKGVVIKVEWIQESITYVEQGIKKDRQGYYDNRYTGGNGTYVTGGEYFSEIEVHIKVVDMSGERILKFNIKDEVLEANDKKRMSDALYRYLKQNEGKEVELTINSNGNVEFDPEKLPYFIRDKK